MRTRRKYVVYVVLALAMGCAKAPPSLSPRGQAAFYAQRAVDILDVLRDAAIAAHDQKLITEDSARQVVLYHKAALTTIRHVPDGWLQTVRAGLAELRGRLVESGPRAHDVTLAPYLALADTVLNEIAKAVWPIEGGA